MLLVLLPLWLLVTDKGIPFLGDKSRDDDGGWDSGRGGSSISGGRRMMAGALPPPGAHLKNLILVGGVG